MTRPSAASQNAADHSNFQRQKRTRRGNDRPRSHMALCSSPPLVAGGHCAALPWPCFGLPTTPTPTPRSPDMTLARLEAGAVGLRDAGRTGYVGWLQGCWEFLAWSARGGQLEEGRALLLIAGRPSWRRGNNSTAIKSSILSPNI